MAGTNDIIGIAAAIAKSVPGTAGAAAVEAQEAAEAAAAEAQEILESIPEDYSELSADVSDLKSAISDIEDELFTAGNLLNVSTFYSNSNNSVVNNGDGTFTFGTTDRGTTCWESIGNVPAGNYELIGLPSSASGWTYVSTEPSYSSGVITNNSSAENVSYTNPTSQKLYILVYLRSNPSASFTLEPAIGGGKQSVINGIKSDVSDLQEAVSSINDDIDSMDNRMETLEPDATSESVGKYVKVKSVDNGKVTEYEFATPSGGGGDTSDLYVDSVIEFKPDYNIHSEMMIDSSDGSIDSAGTSSQKVLEFPVSKCSKFRMQASAYGGNSGALYAFYTSESFSGCGTSTLIDSVKTYDRRAAIYDYDIPEDAKWCCVYISSMDYISCIKVTSNIKGYASIADEYDPDNGIYRVGEPVMHEGLMYKCIVPITTPEEWNDAHWVLTTVKEKVEEITARTADISKVAKYQVGTINPSTGIIETNQKYRIVSKNAVYFEKDTEVSVASGYVADAFYYNADGSYTGINRNLAQVAYHYNIIPAGSYVKFQIQINGSSVMLTDLDIPELTSKVTYKAPYAILSDQVDINIYNSTNGMTARMYAKGAAQKSFSHAVGIILAGQSNIAGVIDSADIPSTITFPMTNIKYSRSNTPTTFDDGISSSASWGVDLSMFDALNKLDAGTFYGIKYAAPGTGIDIGSSSEGNSRWTAYYERLASIDKSLLYTLETKIRTLAERNPNTYDVRAMVWHQGENDSTFSNSGNVAIPKRYYENFKYVIAYVRGVIGNERLPVIYGTISHNSIAYDPIIEAAQWRIAEEDPNVYCIDMSGAELKDDYHFNAASAVYFGHKAFDALIDFGVVSGTKINPTPPWENT